MWTFNMWRVAVIDCTFGIWELFFQDYITLDTSTTFIIYRKNSQKLPQFDNLNFFQFSHHQLVIHSQPWTWIAYIKEMESKSLFFKLINIFSLKIAWMFQFILTKYAFYEISRALMYLILLLITPFVSWMDSWNLTNWLWFSFKRNKLINLVSSLDL